MVEWTRNTPWRQGHLLTNDAILATGLSHPKYPDDSLVIVASHDCDLAQHPDKEPQIEVLVGHKIAVLDGNNTLAKSSRTLHIGFQCEKVLLGEFVVTEKTSIPKKALVDFAPLTDARLIPSDLAIFQLWLASRYRRSAFPDEFERRLKESGLSDKISKALKPSSMMITAIFFDVDEGQEIVRTRPGDVYTLGIILLHAAEPDFYAAEEAAKKVKAEIERAFKARLFNEQSEEWQSIELRYFDVISEEAMTYRQSQLLKKWRLDHISMGADPQQLVSIEE